MNKYDMATQLAEWWVQDMKLEDLEHLAAEAIRIRYLTGWDDKELAAEYQNMMENNNG